MTIIDDLNWRYATKEFNPIKKVPSEDLEKLTDALVLSPSSFGLQAWKFLIIEDQSTKEALLPHSWNQTQVTECSHLIVLTRPETLTEKDVDKLIAATAKTRNIEKETLTGYADIIKGFITNKSENELQVWMEKQVYIALGFLMSTAAQLKIDTCPMEGFSSKDYDKVLNLEDQNLASVVACPIGYRSETDKYATQSKVRYPKSDLILTQ